MGEAAAISAAGIKEVCAAVDLLHGRLAVVDTTQQSVVAQLSIIAESVQAGSLTQAANARQFEAMERRLEEAIATLARLHVRPPSPEEDDADPDDAIITDRGKVTTTHVLWTGDTAGAGMSSAHHTGEPPRGAGGGRPGGAGGGDLGGVGGGALGGGAGGGLGGAGGGCLGGAGGGRNLSGDANSRHNLKMSFP